MKVGLRFFLVFCLVWIVCRGAIYFLPGDPATYLVHESLVQVSVEQLRAQMDLDQPLWHRLFSWPASKSLITHQSTITMTSIAFGRSLFLTFLTLLFSGLFSLFLLYLSYFSARTRRLAETYALFSASTPLFVLSPLLLLFFSIRLKLFPVVHSPILPALALSFYLSAFWYQSLSQKMNRYLPISATPGARARGIAESKVFFKYVLYPCLGSFMGFLGTQIGTLFNGSILVEMIFQWNGLGSLLLDSVLSRDYAVIEVTLLWVTLITLLAQQVGYALQRSMEPRLT